MPRVNNLDEDLSPGRIRTSLPSATRPRRYDWGVVDAVADCRARRNFASECRQVALDPKQGRVSAVDTRHQGRIHARETCVRNQIEPGDSRARRRARGVALQELR